MLFEIINAEKRQYRIVFQTRRGRDEAAIAERNQVFALEGKFTSYTFRVNHGALPEVWRDIELAFGQTLDDLHLTTQQAHAWYDDHLYSCLMKGKAWDSGAEIGSPWSDCRVHTHQVQVGQLELKEG